MAEQTTGGMRRAKRWSEAEARRVLAAWEKSGKSVGAFARSNGVTPQRLYWWRERLGKGGNAATGPEFVPVVVKHPVVRLDGSVALVVTTPDGAHVEVREVSSSTAAWVVALLERGGRS
jgi:transposase-like protein